MILSILPDELRVPLDKEVGAGVVGFARPFDVLEKSRWYDATREDGGIASAVLAGQRQFLRIEGDTIQVKALDGALVPFDPTNAAHVARLPIPIVVALGNAVIERSNLDETTSGN